MGALRHAGLYVLGSIVFFGLSIYARLVSRMGRKAKAAASEKPQSKDDIFFASCGGFY